MGILTTNEIITKLKQYLKEGRRCYGRRDKLGQKHVYQQAIELAASSNLGGEVLLFQGCLAVADGEWKTAEALLEKTLATDGLILKTETLDRMAFVCVQLKLFEKAIELLKSVLEDEQYEMRGDAWNNMGFAHAESKEYAKAIECYQKALAEKSYDAPGNAWNNIGAVHHRMKEYAKAIECYQKALAEKSYATPGDAWNNMGIAHHRMKEYSKAMECYQKAIAEKSFDTPGKAWNNMGLTYSRMKEYAKAIECYQKAIAEKSYDTPGNAWYNMALVYRDQERFADAQRCLVEAAQAYRKSGQSDCLGMVESLRGVLEGLIRSRKGGQEGLEERYSEAAKLATPATVAPTSPATEEETGGKTSQVLTEIKEIISNTTSTENYRKRKHPKLGNWLICLRGWSSSTNLISIAHPEFYAGAKCCGGGFLLNWRNAAHIVDPGADFLDTFCKFNVPRDDKPPHILQVHSVQTTHRHPDHSGDLAAITQLDNDVAGNDDRKLQFNLDKDTYDSIPSLLRERQGRDRVRVRILDDNSLVKLCSGTVSLRAFKVDHGAEAPNACGLSFKLKPKKPKDKTIGVGFTGDTKWFPDVGKKLADCGIIVCNFSATRIRDIGEQEFKKDHLGFLGLLELVNCTSANVYVVTEFWGQLGDIRIPITRYLLERVREMGKRTKNPPVIIPADVGLIIDVEKLTVMCSHCLEFVPAAQITAISGSPSFGRLLYLCPRHMMKQ